MTTYNTGNPLGSVDVRDLYDNAQNFDKFVNGTLDAYQDRLGVTRESWAGMEADFETAQTLREEHWEEFLAGAGYQILGPYAAGLEFTSYNQTFSYLGEFYAPGPSITLPYTTTGAGAGEIANFRSVGDAVLRQDLTNIVDPLKGAAMIGHSGRTLADRLEDTVSAKDIPGTVGGVGVDETVHLQAGIDATPHGGTFFIPAGTWEYTHLVVDKPMVIRGAGGPSTSLYSTASTGNGIEFTGAGRIYQVGVKDLRIGSTANSTAGSALRFANVGHGFIENVWLSGSSPTTRPYNGVSLSDAAQFSVMNLQINDCRNTGLSITDHCIDIYVSNSRSDANVGDGILIRDSEGMYFSNTTAYFNDGVGWRLPYGGAFANKNMFFSNCVGDSSGSANWLIQDLSNAFFANCWGCTQKSPALNFVSGFMCIKPVGAQLNRLAFTNCIANNNNRHGFSIEGADHVTIENSMAEANGVVGAGSGFNISLSAYVSLGHVRALSNADRGIIVGATCPLFSVTDSYSYFNVNGPYFSSTAGVVVRNLQGFEMTNTGSGVIASAATSVVVPHGLNITPIGGTINITPTNNPTNDYGNFWLSAIGGTTFTLNLRSAPGVSTFTFDWSVAEL